MAASTAAGDGGGPAAAGRWRRAGGGEPAKASRLSPGKRVAASRRRSTVAGRQWRAGSYGCGPAGAGRLLWLRAGGGGPAPTAAGRRAGGGGPAGAIQW